ncbi:cadherin repeat domain-containing protein [Pseudoroseomonas cervicalis]|uniref:cadherin repeat domain-containing protein n=1 Tax=Teichococcus cervicalis TaxID=204525 RepID=UPI00278A8762|nr:cadherin repeat domain-containing protein [Pseudoroseomonas cervicalis]MDQ1079688.1 hypothetical protein [Pseudoroseomonas cervicalis]
MSGSIPPDVELRMRLGPYATHRRQQIKVGSTIRVYVDVLDRVTQAKIPGATGAAAIYWLPTDLDITSPGQPAEVSEVSPGTLAFDVPGELFGTYAVWLGIGGPSAETVDGRFDVIADGADGWTATQWSGLQAAAAAAGASAARQETRAMAATLAAEAGAAAGAAKVMELVSQRPAKVITARRYLLAVEDSGATLVFTSSAPTWVDVPLGLPVGFQVMLVMGGVAPVRINPMAGVYIPTESGHNGIATRSAGATLLAAGPDSYILFGASADVTAAFEPLWTLPPALSSYAFPVTENVPTGTVVGRVEARGAGPIELKLASGNVGGAFALVTVEEGIADLVTAGPIDFEVLPSYALSIGATNGNGTAYATALITVIDVPPVAPRPGQVFGVLDGAPSRTPIGVVQVTDGQAVDAFRIAPGAGAELFGIDSSGLLSVEVPPDYQAAPQRVIEITTTDHEGTSPPVPVKVMVVKAPLTYAPISDGAQAWWRPAVASTLTLQDGGVQQLRDVGPRGLAWSADIDQDIYPRPALLQGAAGIGSRDAILFAEQARLNGNAGVLSLTQDAEYLGLEMVLLFPSVGGASDIINLSRSQDRQARFNLALSTQTGRPALRLVTRRLDTDAGVRHDSSVRIFPATPIYVYVGVDWQAGETTLQVNTVSEVQAQLWASGPGRTEDLPSKWGTLGSSSNAAGVMLADCVPWRSRPSPELLAENRLALASHYGIP